MATYYVAEGGSTAKLSATDPSTPMSVAEHNDTGTAIPAGSTVYLLDTITSQVTAPSNGTAGNRIEYRGDYPGRQALLTHATANEYGMQPSKNYLYVHHINFSGNDIAIGGTNNATIGFIGSEIAYCNIENATKHGIYLLTGNNIASYAAVSGLRIHHNTVSDCGRHGIAVVCNCSDVMIDNNTVIDCASEAGGSNVYWGIYSAPKRRLAESSSSWSSGGSDVWTIALNTLAPGSCTDPAGGTCETVSRVILRADAATTWLTEGTYGSLAEWEWDQDGSGNVQIRTPSIDPRTINVEICTSGHSGVVISNNTVSGTGGTDGIGLGFDTGSTNSKIIANRTYNNDGFGIDLNGADNIDIWGNLVYNNGATLTRDGISVQYPGSNGVRVYNNTCASNNRHQLRINQGLTDLVTIRNNIFYGGSTTDIATVGTTTSYVESHNGAYGAPTINCTTSAVLTDPGLDASYVPQSAAYKAVGTWIAGVKAYDDLPLPLHPDIGAVQDRNAAGRKFGVGGGAL